MEGPRVTGETPGVPVVTILRIVRSARLERKNLSSAENSQIVVRSVRTIGLNSQRLGGSAGFLSSRQLRGP